jgi:hypothetical protein
MASDQVDNVPTWPRLRPLCRARHVVEWAAVSRFIAAADIEGSELLVNRMRCLKVTRRLRDRKQKEANEADTDGRLTHHQ